MRLLLAAFILFAAIGNCRRPSSQVETPSLPNQIVEGFVLHESSSGERLYTLKAETAYVYDVEQRVEVARPEVLFYDADARVHATLVADRGAIYSRTNDLVAHGHVNVTTEDSTRLWTDSLSWNNNTKLVRTDAPVEIETPRGRVSGIGLVSDAGLSRIEIQSEVQGSSSFQFGVGRETDSGPAPAESAR